MNFEALIDELDQEEVEDALRMTDEQKLRAGAELFEYACSVTSAGIKSDHPEWTSEQVFLELRRRVEEQDRDEDHE